MDPYLQIITRKRTLSSSFVFDLNIISVNWIPNPFMHQSSRNWNYVVYFKECLRVVWYETIPRLFMETPLVNIKP